jgi:hypothetical protein
LESAQRTKNDLDRRSQKGGFMSAGYDWKRIFEPKSWKITINAVVIIGIISCVLFGGYSIYRFFFPKKSTQSNQITVQSGGQATIIQKNDRQRWIIPFVECGAEARDKEKIGAFIRAGVRFEW